MYNDLYQEVILDHYRDPSNVGHVDGGLEQRNMHASCGDKILLSLKVENGIVTDIAFQGSGCSISTASTSLMTEAVKGHTVDEVKAMFDAFRDMIHGKEPNEDLLGDIVALQGVAKLPARVPCAELGWETLGQILGFEPKDGTSSCALG